MTISILLTFKADVCHAYQIIHAHGIPDERVIVMMQDDIAYNSLWEAHFPLFSEICLKK